MAGLVVIMRGASGLLLSAWVMACGTLGATPAMAQSINPYQAQELNEAVAAKVLPFSQMACAAYGDCKQDDLVKLGFVRDLDWKQAMTRAGVGSQVIDMYSRAGFHADIFRNDTTKQLIVAYRGSDDLVKSLPDIFAYAREKRDDAIGITKLKELLGTASKDAGQGDWATNLRARFDAKSPIDRLEAQYVAARSLASRLDRVYSGTAYSTYSNNVALTGQSLGGALASYAGQQLPRAEIVTIEAARNIYGGTGDNPRQLNIIARGDPVSDPNSRLGYSAGSTAYLPGRTYVIPELKGLQKHDAKAAVVAIDAISTGSFRASRQLSEIATPSVAGSSLPSAPARAPATVAVSPGIGFQQAPRPSGVLLGTAAAEQMRIDIDLDAASYVDGKIILAGKGGRSTLDVPLFLTAMRLACEEIDPYFSLDPIDGKVWNQEGEAFAESFFQIIKQNVFPDDVNWKDAPSGLLIRTISARRDYPVLWEKLVGSYKNFRTKLVFKPTWLSETRLGNILYRADILLKELSSGAAMLDIDPQVKAYAVQNYMSATVRNLGAALLSGEENKAFDQLKGDWRGFRLWFDIAIGTDAPDRPNYMLMPPAPTPLILPVLGVPGTGGAAPNPLVGLLAARGYGLRAQPDLTIPSVAVDGGVVDVSRIFPRMFVRIFDGVARRDLPGSDPAHNALAADINLRTSAFAAQYEELRDLIDIVRGYVVAVHLAKQDRLARLSQPG